MNVSQSTNRFGLLIERALHACGTAAPRGRPDGRISLSRMERARTGKAENYFPRRELIFQSLVLQSFMKCNAVESAAYAGFTAFCFG
jgi:hypothetical protein